MYRAAPEMGSISIKLILKNDLIGFQYFSNLYFDGQEKNETQFVTK